MPLTKAEIRQKNLARHVANDAQIRALKAASKARRGTGRTPRDGSRWLPEDDRILRWDWGTESVRRLAQKLGRTRRAVLARAAVLHLGPQGQGTLTLRALSASSGYHVRRIRLAITALGLEPRRIAGRSTRAWPSRRVALTERQAAEVLAQLAAEPDVLPRPPPRRRPEALLTAGRWGVGGHPEACAECGGTDSRHVARGVCQRCYQRLWQRAQRAA